MSSAIDLAGRVHLVSVPVLVPVREEEPQIGIAASNCCKLLQILGVVSILRRGFLDSRELGRAEQTRVDGAIEGRDQRSSNSNGRTECAQEGEESQDNKNQHLSHGGYRSQK